MGHLEGFTADKCLGPDMKNKDNVPVTGVETVSKRAFLKEAASFPERES